jgi:transcriptional regulator GlxA family with amidase domain
MKRKLLLMGSLSTVVLLITMGGIWIVTLPAAPVRGNAPAIGKDEAEATLSALQPPKRQRPVIAIVGANEGSETTDYLTPYGILKRADVADVFALGMKPGPISLYPALEIVPHTTVANFDAMHPEGADYVIVPAMRHDDDEAVLRWINQQAAKGAIIIGVCAGAKILGNAGLLDGRRATTHWYSVKQLRKRHPTMHYMADRRLVVDRGVATTTGLTASISMSLTLIEAIAGTAKARAVANDLGAAQWDARHYSSAFTLTRPFALSVLGNTIAFWNHEQLGIPLTPGIDEVSLALVADAWSRTYRSRAVTFASTGGAQETRNGISVLPDRIAQSWPAENVIPAIDAQQPVRALDQALQRIAQRYGTRTANFVAVQLEYHKQVEPE